MCQNQTDMGAIQSMLAAVAEGKRVTIGRESLAELRRLADGRRLACPSCGAQVVLHAGTLRAVHFAHLPGSVCAHPYAEPETELHRAGKSLLAAWLATCLPDALVTVEAPIPETGQRADILVESEGRRVALEYQCADLDYREWRRRHHLYRAVGIQDLWVLGANRLRFRDGALYPGELERALLREGAPLLFLDPVGLTLEAGSVARFRPASFKSRCGPAGVGRNHGTDSTEAGRDGARPLQRERGCGQSRHFGGAALRGSLSARTLVELEFPWKLLDWPEARRQEAGGRRQGPGRIVREYAENDARIWSWLTNRFHVTEQSLPAFFGAALPGAEAFACSPRLWQACIYYRFIEHRVGAAWWIGEVEVWARRYLPLAYHNGKLLRRALWGYQALVSAAGLLSLPTGKGAARVEADFHTLGRVPDLAAAQRLASYRRTLLWDRK